ncbi:hypothetical protein, partial [Enterobacter hormaechei]|uniref:hypothetical protein n=1 Tax=Enterobacter hormaechei TaxID=158836 RepID=UPI0020402525
KRAYCLKTQPATGETYPKSDLFNKAGESMKMMDMSGHDQAAMSHEMMQNGNSAAHQDMAEMHKKMMKSKPAASNETAKSFSEMNEHEKAAVVHEKANNGQSSVIHQQQAEKHRSQITQN